MTEIAEVKSRLSTVYVFGRKKQMSGLQRKEINQMRKWNKRLLSGCLLAALLLSMSGCQQGNTTSSAVSSQAVSSAAASSEETTEGPVETYHDMPVQTLDLDPSDPDYYQKALETVLPRSRECWRHLRRQRHYERVHQVHGLPGRLLPDHPGLGNCSYRVVEHAAARWHRRAR